LFCPRAATKVAHAALTSGMLGGSKPTSKNENGEDIVKKQTLLLASLCLWVGITVIPADGQTSGVKVRVPFKFMVAEETLQAGEYVLSSVRDRVLIQDSDGKSVAIVLANGVSGHSSYRNGQVVFRCYVDQCFLSQLWAPTRDEGRQLLQSRREKEVAKRETGKYFALLGIQAQTQR
jgi:hypothetical protein